MKASFDITGKLKKVASMELALIAALIPRPSEGDCLPQGARRRVSTVGRT